MKLKDTILYLFVLIVVFMSCTTDDTNEINPIDTIIEGVDAVQGTGTDADPYRLSVAEHLDVFMRNGLSSTYVLMNDIDLSAHISENYPVEGWLPINNFAGILDGSGFKISGLSIDRGDTDDVGFFGSLGNDSNSNAVTIEIKNLTLEIASGSSVIGKTRVGGLVGHANDGLRITNVHINGADLESKVESTETTNTTDLGRSGGMIGLADRCTILRCSSAIKVVSNGGGRIGGLAGMVNTTTVDESYSSGEVHAQFEDIGGLIGYAHNAGTAVTNSYATGNIFITGNSTDDVGGFVGATHSSFTPINCYSAGSISIAATLIDSYGYFSGDGDGGSSIFGSALQTIIDGSNADITSGAVEEDTGFILINISTSTCVDFSAFDTSIWACIDGSFPTLINNP